MSFWGGVAKGLEAGEAKREREEVRDTAAARNALQDKRWQMQWEQSQENLKYNRDRDTKADELAADALEIARIKELNNIINTGRRPGTTRSGTAGSKVPTGAEMNISKMSIQAALGGADGLSELPEDQRLFYTAVLSDGSAAAQATAFAKTNKIPINQVHNYMEVGAVVEAQGAEGMAKLRAGIADGSIDVGSSAETFMKSYKTALAFVPGFTLLSQTSQIRDLSKDKLAYEAVVKNMNAYLGQDLAKLKASGGDSSALHQLYNDLTSSNETTQAAAMGALFNKYGGSVSTELLQEGNPFFTPFLSNTGRPGLAEPMNFDTKEEAEIFFDSGNTVTSFTVGGLPQLYYPKATTSENPPKVQVGTPVGVGKAVSDTTTAPTGTAATVDVFKDRDGNIASYGELFRGMQSLPEDQRAAYAKQFIELENDPALADFASIAQNFSDDAAGKVYGGAMWALGAYTAGVAKVGNFLTGDTARATRIALNANQQKTKAKEIMAEGIVEHLQELADTNNVQGSFGPGRAEAIKRGLLKSNTLDIPAEEALGLASEDTNRRIAEEDMAMARPVPQPLGTIAFNGPTAGDDTNKRIAEEDAAMNVDFPQPLDAVTFNGPTAEDGLMSMPVEQAGGFEEVMQSLATASDEEKSVILSKYIGEDGLPIRKPDYAGGRLADTNKRIAEEDAAMAVDFPQPLKDIVLKARSSGEEKFQPATMAATELNTPVIQKALSIVSTVVGPEVAAVLATGFQPDTLGSPELNTPAIQQALTVVGEKVGPEVAAIIAVGFKPATMGATELNTPAVREAIANVPTEVKEAVEAIITTGNESDIEQAASEVAAEFGESVAAILFDDLKSARGTGKSAMMSGLQ
jgi:hypothetical protein